MAGRLLKLWLSTPSRSNLEYLNRLSSTAVSRLGLRTLLYRLEASASSPLLLRLSTDLLRLFILAYTGSSVAANCRRSPTRLYRCWLLAGALTSSWW